VLLNFSPWVQKSSHPWRQTDILLSIASQNALLGTLASLPPRLRQGWIFPLIAVIPSLL